MYKFTFKCYNECCIPIKKIDIITIKIIDENEEKAIEQVYKIKGDRDQVKLIEIEKIEKLIKSAVTPKGMEFGV